MTSCAVEIRQSCRTRRCLVRLEKGTRREGQIGRNLKERKPRSAAALAMAMVDRVIRCGQATEESGHGMDYSRKERYRSV